MLNYSLLAFAPWEGYKVAITGDRGRLEMDVCEAIGRTFVAGEAESPSDLEAARQAFRVKEIRLYPMFGLPRRVAFEEAAGGHGGGDRIMLEQLFAPDPPADPFRRAASHVDGAASILLGIAANRSIASGRLVKTSELVAL